MVVRLSLKILILYCVVHYDSAEPCQREFIQSHLLVGLKESVPLPMTICTNVKSRCCTIADEIKIVKYFKESSIPAMNQHTDRFLSILTSIMKTFESFKLMDPLAMNIRYKARKEVPYD